MTPAPAGIGPAPRELPPLATAPTVLAVVLLFIATASDGAFAIRQWGPLGVFVLVCFALVRTVRPRGAALWAVAALWGYAGWSLASTVWADAPSRAIEGGARNLVYAALFSLPFLSLPDRRTALTVAKAVALGFGCLVAVTAVAATNDGLGHFLAGRLNEPIGYRNATAAAFGMAFWPLACAAAPRDSPALIRAAAFAAATTSLGLAFLTQSRGALIGFAAAAAVALFLGPERRRRAWLAVLALCAVALSSSSLLEPYRAFQELGGTSLPDVREAMGALGLMAALSFVAVLLLALVDGGLRVGQHRMRTVSRLGSIALVILSLGAAAAALVAVGNPVEVLRDRAREFRQLDAPGPGETRLGSTGGQRYDLWRIALLEFEAAPLTGVGEGSYATRYYAERRTDRNLLTPHSLPFGVLAEKGLVGLLAFTAFLAALAVALARGWPSATREQRRWSSALASAGAVLLGQSAVDWLWVIPGVTGVGLVCLALAGALVTLPMGAEPVERARARWRVLRAGLCLAAAMLVGALFLSDVHVRLARTQDDPVARLASARNAERANPLALTPLYIQAGALESLRRVDEARRVLLRALDREPRNFATMGLLGDLETRAGNATRARAWYRRALALNPRDVGLQRLAR